MGMRASLVFAKLAAWLWMHVADVSGMDIGRHAGQGVARSLMRSEPGAVVSDIDASRALIADTVATSKTEARHRFRSLSASRLQGELSELCIAVSASAERARTCVIVRASGELRCWGYNGDGILGYGDKEERHSPPFQSIELGSGLQAVQISIGSDHQCAILGDGSLKCWGFNGDNRLGLPNAERFIGGERGEMGDDLPSVDLGEGRKANQVVAGVTYTCVLLDNAMVKCFGKEIMTGQDADADTEWSGGDGRSTVPLGSTHKEVVLLVRGEYSVCALNSAGHMKCWGENSKGGLGYADTSNRGGGVNASMGEDLPIVNVGEDYVVLQASMGYRHTCAVLDLARLDVTGHVKCWGAGLKGATGYDDQVDRHDPSRSPTVNLGEGRLAKEVHAGTANTCVLLTDESTVKCWGDGWWGDPRGDGEGDQETEMGDQLPQEELGGLMTKVLHLSMRGPDACAEVKLARTDDSDDHQHVLGSDRSRTTSLKCWGENRFGQLGLGDTMTRGAHSRGMGSTLPIVKLPVPSALRAPALPLSATKVDQACHLGDKTDDKDEDFADSREELGSCIAAVKEEVDRALNKVLRATTRSVKHHKQQDRRERADREEALMALLLKMHEGIHDIGSFHSENLDNMEMRDVYGKLSEKLATLRQRILNQTQSVLSRASKWKQEAHTKLANSGEHLSETDIANGKKAGKDIESYVEDGGSRAAASVSK